VPIIEDTSTPTATEDVGPDYVVYDNSGDIIGLINQERCNRGLPPVAVHADLNSAATTHSIDMAVNDFVDHTGSDGSSPGDRIAATGYPAILLAENIAGGATSVGQVFNQWMNSPSHATNILNPDIREIGLGHVVREAAEFDHYWTLVLASRGTPAGTCD
jgi:uncharacterized protein YkwD